MHDIEYTPPPAAVTYGLLVQDIIHTLAKAPTVFANLATSKWPIRTSPLATIRTGEQAAKASELDPSAAAAASSYPCLGRKTFGTFGRKHAWNRIMNMHINKHHFRDIISIRLTIMHGSSALMHTKEKVDLRRRRHLVRDSKHEQLAGDRHGGIPRQHRKQKRVRGFS